MIHVHTQSYMYTCVDACTHAMIHVHIQSYVYSCVDACTYADIRVHMQSYMYTCVDACTVERARKIQPTPKPLCGASARAAGRLGVYMCVASVVRVSVASTLTYVCKRLSNEILNDLNIHVLNCFNVEIIRNSSSNVCKY